MSLPPSALSFTVYEAEMNVERVLDLPSRLLLLMGVVPGPAATSVTWDLVRNAGGGAVCVFTSPPGDCSPLRLENHGAGTDGRSGTSPGGGQMPLSEEQSNLCLDRRLCRHDYCLLKPRPRMWDACPSTWTVKNTDFGKQKATYFFKKLNSEQVMSLPGEWTQVKQSCRKIYLPLMKE